MMTVADVNVLVAILAENHQFHKTAWEWWERQDIRTVALTLLTRMGTLRLLTNAKVMAGSSVSLSAALSAWDELAADSRTCWLDPGQNHEAWFRHFFSIKQPSPNLCTDAWLAALAESDGCRLASFDGDFLGFDLRNFEHLRP